MQHRPAPDTPWLQAHVVLDFASVCYSITEARHGPDDQGRGRPRLLQPDLRHAAAALAHHGITVTGWTVALPDTQVHRLGARTNDDVRAMVASRVSEWTRSLRDHTDVPVTVVRGGFDHREFGVDDVAVAAAMIRAGELTHDDGLLIISADEDVATAAEYVAGPACYVLRDRPMPRSHRSAFPWIHVGPAIFDHFAPGATSQLPSDLVIEDRQGDGQVRLWGALGDRACSSDLAVARDGAEHRVATAATGTRTVAVVDAHGLATTAQRAIGAGRIPDVDSVERVLSDLGFDDPVAHWFVVPDVSDDSLYRLRGSDGAVHRQRRAWRELDRELAFLVDALETDDDPTTSATRSHLYPDRQGERDPDLRAVCEKRATAALVSDVVHALQTSDAHVVVLSDRPEVDLVLRRLPKLGLPTGRVTRVGAHAETLAGNNTPAARHSTIQLTEALLATLTRVADLEHGPELRSALARVHTMREVHWEIVELDALSDGVVVRAVDDPDLQLRLGRVLTMRDDRVDAALKVGRVTTGTDLQLRLRFDPARPCDAPAPLVTGATHGTRTGVVLQRRGGTLTIDTDGDGAAEVITTVGHADDPAEPGETVALLDDGTRLHLIGRLTDPEQEPVVLEVARVVRVDGGAAEGAVTAALLSDATGREVPLRREGPLPGRCETGDTVLVVADGPEFRPLSTRLQHLERG